MKEISKIRMLVHDTNPIVHTITNYVAANDTANLLLACNAKPIMSDMTEEIDEIERISKALLLNLGTPGFDRVGTMIKAGETANKYNIPVVFDPVGIAISSVRRTFAKEILSRVKVTVIKCNVTELGALSKMYSARGNDTKESASLLSRALNCIVVVTDKKDIITNGAVTYLYNNGNPMMSKVTGTGCMMGALIAAYIGVQKTESLSATLNAVVTFNVAGEVAFERMGSADGNASYRNYLIDSIHSMTWDELEARANYESR